MKTLCIILIRFYQLAISPMLGNCCRFTPSCSEYTLQAIKKYGAFKGSWLGLKRILKCYPSSKYFGDDPVP
ncbi:Putative membrane protein insertion efficiency factor [Candidatus Rubidus massiliensis]|nr:MAG: membrane protein insertion efficiency factor YidD [Chlamydia sp. 32-24]CDZ80897.1 Putative membrane protein insertion efficiency factor [Candidatus Rubidus massiliensis]